MVGNSSERESDQSICPNLSPSDQAKSFDFEQGQPPVLERMDTNHHPSSSSQLHNVDNSGSIRPVSGQSTVEGAATNSNLFWNFLLQYIRLLMADSSINPTTGTQHQSNRGHGSHVNQFFNSGQYSINNTLMRSNQIEHIATTSNLLNVHSIPTMAHSNPPPPPPLGQPPLDQSDVNLLALTILQSILGFSHTNSNGTNELNTSHTIDNTIPSDQSSSGSSTYTITRHQDGSIVGAVPPATQGFLSVSSEPINLRQLVSGNSTTQSSDPIWAIPVTLANASVSRSGSVPNGVEQGRNLVESTTTPGCSNSIVQNLGQFWIDPRPVANGELIGSIKTENDLRGGGESFQNNTNSSGDDDEDCALVLDLTTHSRDCLDKSNGQHGSINTVEPCEMERINPLSMSVRWNRAMDRYQVFSNQIIASKTLLGGPWSISEDDDCSKIHKMRFCWMQYVRGSSQREEEEIEDYSTPSRDQFNQRIVGTGRIMSLNDSMTPNVIVVTSSIRQELPSTSSRFDSSNTRTAVYFRAMQDIRPGDELIICGTNPIKHKPIVTSSSTPTLNTSVGNKNKKSQSFNKASSSLSVVEQPQAALQNGSTRTGVVSSTNYAVESFLVDEMNPLNSTFPDRNMVGGGENDAQAPSSTSSTNEATNLVNAHSTEGDYSCPHCGKIFAYAYYREKHMKYTRCVDNGDRLFRCDMCSRSFEKRDRLRIHVQHVHQQYRPHKCNTCGKCFSQSSSLNKHYRVHTGERPYKCSQCDRAFTASSILRTHMRQHSGEKPFKCRVCKKAFASHAAHDSHLKRIHPGVPKHIRMDGGPFVRPVELTTSEQRS